MNKKDFQKEILALEKRLNILEDDKYQTETLNVKYQNDKFLLNCLKYGFLIALIYVVIKAMISL